MADAHALPAPLRPGPHEHGLASGDLVELTASMTRGWELFAKVASSADLEEPSRRADWAGRDVVARVGAWDFARGIDDLLADAHDGEAGYHDSDHQDAAVLERTRELPEEQILASIDAAAEATADWLSGEGPAVWGLVPTSSPLGPLPVLTVLHAMNFQLAVAALDLEPCGTTVPDELLELGLVALVDTTGALAGRQHITGSFVAHTPELTLGIGSHAGRWRTAELPADARLGPGVETTARILLDITSGRGSPANLYRSGQLRVHDVPGLLRLAPALEGVPGIPPIGAIGRALSMVDAVGGLLGRFRR